MNEEAGVAPSFVCLGEGDSFTTSCVLYILDARYLSRAEHKAEVCPAGQLFISCSSCSFCSSPPSHLTAKYHTKKFSLWLADLRCGSRQTEAPLLCRHKRHQDGCSALASGRYVLHFRTIFAHHSFSTSFRKRSCVTYEAPPCRRSLVPAIIIIININLTHSLAPPLVLPRHTTAERFHHDG